MSLSIHADPVGRGTVAVVSARLDGEVVAVERIDLAKSKERSRFIADLRARLGSAADELLDAAAVERDLAAAAATLAAPPAAMPSPEVVEIGDGQVVRPERFILPAVSGLVVPRRVAIDGQPVSEWMVYLRWSDGRREAMRLPEVLDHGSEQVFITPTPPPPPPDMAPGWSASSRAAWLDGKPGMPPDEVCRLLLESFARYLDLPAETAAGTVALLATYALLTYMPPAFDALPYLAVSGPAGSGKTRVLELLQQVGFRPMFTSSTSEAVIFRTLHAYGGTALIDEAERLGEPDMQGVLSNLLAGYKRGGCATRCEATGDGRFITRYFSVYGPKAFAAIREVPPTLASRSISVPMLRSPPGSPKPLLRLGEDGERWRALRDALHVLAMEHGSEWLDLPRRKDVVPAMTTGRNFELWQPLLSIAAWLDDHGARGMLDLLRGHAVACIEASRETGTPADDELLLQALARAIGSGVPPTPGELLETVTATEPTLFRNWSARAVACHMARYGLKTKKHTGRRVLAVTTGELLRVQTAYGLDLGLTPTLPPGEVPLSAPTDPETEPGGHIGVHRGTWPEGVSHVV
jgi:hypothetical protein